MFELGLDEAGRGPVLGPMVVAGVVLDAKGQRKLRSLGVADSKRFGAGSRARLRRKELAFEVRRWARAVLVRVATVKEVDRRVARSELNLLERELACSIATKALSVARPVTKIIADGGKVFGPLEAQLENFRAYDKAEDRFVSVAAASIVAKDVRDEHFSLIESRYCREFGELRGGGYMNAATTRFLLSFFERYGRLPPEARRSWPHNYLPEDLREYARAQWPGLHLGLPL